MEKVPESWRHLIAIIIPKTEKEELQKEEPQSDRDPWKKTPRNLPKTGLCRRGHHLEATVKNKLYLTTCVSFLIYHTHSYSMNIF